MQNIEVANEGILKNTITLSNPQRVLETSDSEGVAYDKTLRSAKSVTFLTFPLFTGLVTNPPFNA
jgi:hypothetical protein